MISSHILGELSKIATKYGIIKNGKLIEEITAKELNEKCQCCLKIKASDTAQAAILIEKISILKTTKFFPIIIFGFLNM